MKFKPHQRPRVRSNTSSSKVRLTVGGSRPGHGNVDWKEISNPSPNQKWTLLSCMSRIWSPLFVALLAISFGLYYWSVFSGYRIPVTVTQHSSSNISQSMQSPTSLASADGLKKNGHLTTSIVFNNHTASLSNAIHRKTPSYLNKLQFLMINDKIKLYWKSSLPFQHSKGIVLLLSSCHGTGLEWWSELDSPTFNFDKGRSLPAENNIAKAFVDSGYWVVTMPAVEKRQASGCWVNEDHVHVATAVEYLQQLRINRSQTARTPLNVHALGVMNAGVLLNNNILRWQGLTPPLVFNSIILMNCGIWHHEYEKQPLKYPPVMFVDYQRNGDLALHNNNTAQKMRNANIPSIHYSSDPLPISPDYFTSRISSFILNITIEESRRLHEAMFNAGFIWPGSGILVYDVVGHIHLPKLQRLFQKAAPRIYPKLDVLEGIFSPTLQVLRQAWGFRETNDGFVKEIVSWVGKQTYVA